MLILQPKKELGFLSYQPTVVFENKKQYLRSVNILISNKVVKKIYLDEPLNIYNQEEVENIASEYIISKIKQDNGTKKTKRTKKYKSKKAYNDASVNLLSDLGL